MGWLPRRGNLSPHVRQTISETVQETLQSHGQKEKEHRERSRQSSQGLGKGVRYMRIRELEHPVNEMRQDIVDKWLDSRKDYDTSFLLFNIYGPEGLKKYIENSTKKE